MLADGKFSAYSFDLHLKLQSQFHETLVLFGAVQFITARIRRVGKVMFSFCPSTLGRGGGGWLPQSHKYDNTSTGPMSFPGGTPGRGLNSLVSQSQVGRGTPVPGREVQPDQDRMGPPPPPSQSRYRMGNPSYLVAQCHRFYICWPLLTTFAKFSMITLIYKC